MDECSQIFQTAATLAHQATALAQNDVVQDVSAQTAATTTETITALDDMDAKLADLLQANLLVETTLTTLHDQIIQAKQALIDQRQQVQAAKLVVSRKRIDLHTQLGVIRHNLASVCLEWTHKQHFRVVFDSDKDVFTSTNLRSCVMWRKDFMVIGITPEDDVFGGFVGERVDEPNAIIYDEHQFVFSFQANGRCPTPQQWFPKTRAGANFELYVGYPKAFFGFGHQAHREWGWFVMGDMQTQSFCQSMSHGYKGIADDTLTGKNGERNLHHCKRLLVIQFFN